MDKRKAHALSRSLLWCICILSFPILSGTLSAVLSLGTVETLFLQGISMLLSLTIPLIFILSKKWSWEEIGAAPIDTDGCKRALYLLPLLTIFIPVAVKGLHIRSTAYLLGSLFLYLTVGVAEEIYFRGIIPRYLSEAFSLRGTIVLSIIIFGIGHIAAAFTASSVSEVCLTVLNASIFGWLAIEMAVICNNITPCILFHAMFDFETKIVAMNGAELAAAEYIRGAIMVIAAAWLTVIRVRSEHSRIG